MTTKYLPGEVQFRVRQMGLHAAQCEVAAIKAVDPIDREALNLKADETRKKQWELLCEAEDADWLATQAELYPLAGVLMQPKWKSVLRSLKSAIEREWEQFDFELAFYPFIVAVFAMGFVAYCIYKLLNPWWIG